MKIKLPEKIIFNYLEDDQFMIVDEIEISEYGISQARQFDLHGNIFQIDKEEGTVKQCSSNIVNVSIDVNAIFESEE